MARSHFFIPAALWMIAAPAYGAVLSSSNAPPPPPAPPVFSWTGFYAGGQFGYGFGYDNAVLSGFAPNGIAPAGVTGGAHIGYNYQVSGLAVLGVEGDLEGADIAASSSAFLGPYTVKSPIAASLRGRLGFAVDRALFYATGGVAFATFNNNYATAGIASTSRAGFTAGGGVEYAISGTWSIRGEYRYSEFGGFTGTFAAPAGPVTHKDSQSRAELGFSYKFAEPAAPVVSKY